MKKKYLLTCFLISFSLFSRTYCEDLENSWAINSSWLLSEVNVIENEIINNLNSWSISQIDLEEELKKDWIELDSASTSTTPSIIDKATQIKNIEYDKLMWKTDEEKNIEAIENVLTKLDIKKEINETQLIEIQDNLKELSNMLEENNKNISLLKEWKSITEVKKQLEDLEIKNQELLNEIEFKKKLEKDLSDTVISYNILKEKYSNVLNWYVKLKQEKTVSILKDKEKKIITLFFAILIFIIVYFIKILLLKNKNFVKKHENFWESFNLVFWIIIILFFIWYIFYLFPELYALLIFVSWSLIFINSQVISSFVASILLIKKFNIWDIIKISDERWKIIKITPVNTVIRRINDYWILEWEDINIPNIDLLKEKVSLAKNYKNKENIFNIILNLWDWQDIFEIINHIKDDILLKMITEKLNTVNPLSNDIFETKYEYIDTDKIKITFYWMWENELNRKIEKEIIKFIKWNAIFDKKNKRNKNYNGNTSKVSNDNFKKASLIQDEIDS